MTVTSSLQIEIKTDPQVTSLQYALQVLLYVPDERVKPKIIDEVMRHYQRKSAIPGYRMAIYITYQEDEPAGMVACQIDPEYRTYSRKATTFSWLLCKDFESCQVLMEHVEYFARKHKVRKIRGPINYPKIVGGLGIQTEGFDVPIMNGINFTHPDSKVLEFLTNMGYEIESKYSCVDVVNKNWDKGNILNPEYRIHYFSVEELRAMKAEIINLAENSFYSILADAPGGESRFEEMMRSYELVRHTPFNQEISDKYREQFSDVLPFKEAWDQCDFSNVVCWAPCAFKRDTGELVGIILSLPNLYQSWSGDQLDIANVDTVMVHKEHSGKGIFSTLNNIGRLTIEMYGIIKAEGTSIWANNERAIKTIFPHSKPLRTHVVLQKRVKSNR